MLNPNLPFFPGLLQYINFFLKRYMVAPGTKSGSYSMVKLKIKVKLLQTVVSMHIIDKINK